MGNYLIKAVGVDLASVSNGVSALEFRAGTWETRIVDAGSVHICSGHTAKQTQFSQHVTVANRIMTFIRMHKPDIVGIEDFTNQTNSYVAFSMAHVAGIVRFMIWQEGYRQLLIIPGRITQFIVTTKDRANKTAPTNSGEMKKFTADWIRRNLGQEFGGNKKEREDMADATIYSMIAAVFFSRYWLNQCPPMTTQQEQIYRSKIPGKGSSLWKKGWVPSGLLDSPMRYLIRNIEMEAKTYTPSWLQELPTDARFIGEGTPDYEFPNNTPSRK